MADGFDHIDIISDTEAYDEEAVKLLASMTLKLFGGMSENNVTKLYAPDLEDLEDQNGRSIIPESFVELASRTMERIAERVTDPAMASTRMDIVMEEAEDVWMTQKDDAYLPPDPDLEIVTSEIKDAVATYNENSLDSPNLRSSILTDEDILEQADTGMTGPDGSRIFREVKDPRFFNPDGTFTDEGAFSEKLFGPTQGATCRCGASSSGNNTAVGAICPECGTPVLSSRNRKELSGFMKSPIPLTFGRESAIAAMLYGLVSTDGKKTTDDPVKANNIVKDMAAGGMDYCCVDIGEYSKKQKKYIRKSVRIMPVDAMEELRQNAKEGQRILVKYGTPGLEAALKGLRGEYVEGDRYSALANAEAYRKACNRKHMNDQEVSVGLGSGVHKSVIDLHGEAETAYTVVRNLIEGRRAKPSQILLHFFPVSPPGSRPLNTRNGKTDLGDENAALQKVLYELSSLSDTMSGRGIMWAGAERYGRFTYPAIKAVNEYLDVLDEQNSGKTGFVRKTLETIKGEGSIRVVVTPTGMQGPVSELVDGGLESALSQTTVQLPVQGIRTMYEGEMRNTMKAFGLDDEAIAREMAVKPGTLVDDGAGGKMPCLADQTMEAVLAGYGDNARDTSPIGKLFVPEGNRFGMTRSIARVRYAKEIRKMLHDEYGLGSDDIRKEMLKPVGTMAPEGGLCLADQALNRVCRTEEGGRIVLLTRDPIISAGGIQFMYVRPTPAPNIMIHPLVAKACNADHDGDMMAAMKTKRIETARAAKRIMYRSYQEDGYGTIYQVPMLESIFGLTRMTRSFGDRPDYSYKYPCIITNRKSAEDKGDIRADGTVIRTTDLYAHRILEELDGKEFVPAFKPGEQIPPGKPYGHDKNGTPLYARVGKNGIHAQMIESGGHLYLVDAYPDPMRLPVGAKLVDREVFKEKEPIATARMFRGPLESIERELDRGRLTPQSTIELENPDGTVRRTTAGRALTEQYLPNGFVFGDEEHGLDKKRIEKMLLNEMNRLMDEETKYRTGTNNLDIEEIKDEVTYRMMKMSEALTNFGFYTCNKYLGKGLTMLDFPQVAPIGLDDIFLPPEEETDGKESDKKPSMVEMRKKQKERYDKAVSEARKELYQYMEDRQNCYTKELVESGEKNSVLIQEMVNVPWADRYDSTPLPVLSGGPSTGTYGFSTAVAASNSVSTGNKAKNIDKIGDMRNRIDEAVKGMMFEEGDCGTTLYEATSLTTTTKDGQKSLDPKKVSALTGRTTARDIKDRSNRTVIPSGTILTKEMLENAYSAGVRTIPYRSALTCRCRGVCQKCAGAEANMKSRPGDVVGNAASSAYFEKSEQDGLDNAKKASSGDAENYATVDDLKKTFNGYYVNLRASKYLKKKNPELASRIERIKKAVEKGGTIPERIEGAEISPFMMARIMSNILGGFMKDDFPQLYLELLAKAFVLGYPTKEPVNDDPTLSAAGLETPMTLWSLAAMGDWGHGGFVAENPGSFRNDGTGIDASLYSNWKRGDVLRAVKANVRTPLEDWNEKGENYREDVRRLLEAGQHNRQGRLK